MNSIDTEDRASALRSLVDGWTKEEASLLLYAEHCCVDQRGQLDDRKIDVHDKVILRSWDEAGLILWREASSIVMLTERAFAAAHTLRLQKCRRVGTVFEPETQKSLAALSRTGE